MSRYRHRKQAVRRKNLLGILLILSILAVVVFLAFFRYELQRQQVSYDPETLCPVSEPSPKYVALVFDKSDTYNSVQNHKFRTHKAQMLPS